MCTFKRVFSIGSILVWAALQAQLSQPIRSKKFVIRTVNPFFELYMADIYGNILGQEPRVSSDKFGLFTLKQIDIAGNIKYLLFLKYTNTHRNFLVKKCDEDLNKSTIGTNDLIAFSSPAIPFIIYFGVSKEPNPIFDMQIEGLQEIEKALNEHLKDHPIKIFQEMNMIRYIETSVSFVDMGHIYASNQVILNGTSTEQSLRADVNPALYFHFENNKDRNLSQIVSLAKEFRENIMTIINEYTIVITPNNTLDDLNDPQTEGLKKIKAMRDLLIKSLNKIVSEKKTSYNFRLFLYKNLVRTKKIANYFFDKFILKGVSNILVNPFLFKRPSVYFPGRIEVPIEEFVDVYTREFIATIIPQQQLDIPDHSFIFNLELVFKEFSKQYTSTLNELSVPTIQSFGTEFEKSLMKKMKQLNTLSFHVTKAMRMKIHNGMTNYLMGIYYERRFEKANIFRETSSLINIFSLNEVYQIFSPGRSVNSGYAVNVQVFDVIDDEEENRQKAVQTLI